MNLFAVRNRDPEEENRHTDTRGEERGLSWEAGVDTVHEVDNKWDPTEDHRDSTQHSVLTQTGRGSKQEAPCVRGQLSHFAVPEKPTQHCKSNYTPVKLKKKNQKCLLGIVQLNETSMVCALTFSGIFFWGGTPLPARTWTQENLACRLNAKQRCLINQKTDSVRAPASPHMANLLLSHCLPLIRWLYLSIRGRSACHLPSKRDYFWEWKLALLVTTPKKQTTARSSPWWPRLSVAPVRALRL